MKKALKILLNIGLVLFFIIFFSIEARAEAVDIKAIVNLPPAPTLIAPNEKTVTADLKPLIIGLTKDNSSVKFFIDGVFNGETGILKHQSGTANFAYRPFLNLSRGWHKVQAIAIKDGAASLDSNILNFKIELPFPAPTLLKPVVNKNTSQNRPFVVGLAKNDSRIKIYIDKKYNGELIVNNHLSGTANFAYRPVVALVRGEHSVYTVAVDKRGKESILSNAVSFFIKASAISQSAEEERKEAVVKITEPKKSVEIKSEPVVISKNSGAVLENVEADPAAPVLKPLSAEQKADLVKIDLAEKEQTIKQELKDKEQAALEKVKNLIGADVEEVKSDRGMINEGKQSQGRLKLDLILFILFLVGVVAWLLWVNRELVKERRAQTEAEEKAEADKNNQPSEGQNNKLF